MKTVYLAGPMVFLPEPEAIFAEMKAILAKYDLQGVAPIDNQINLEGIAPGAELNTKIYEADVGIMNSVDAAIFNITPFRRGCEMDTGTAFEIGYCRALGLPMSGWTTDPRTYPEVVGDMFRSSYGLDLVNTASNASGATSGSLRDPDGILVHSAGLHQNLMVQMAIETAGGTISADPLWQSAFKGAVSKLASLVYSIS